MEHSDTLHRFEHLAICGARDAVRFVSFEPLLGPLGAGPALRSLLRTCYITWAITGAESDKGAHLFTVGVVADQIERLYAEVYEAAHAPRLAAAGAPDASTTAR